MRTMPCPAGVITVSPTLGATPGFGTSRGSEERDSDWAENMSCWKSKFWVGVPEGFLSLASKSLPGAASELRTGSVLAYDNLLLS